MAKIAPPFPLSSACPTAAAPGVRRRKPERTPPGEERWVAEDEGEEEKEWRWKKTTLEEQLAVAGERQKTP